jgi:hypothetical protein
MDKKRLIIHPKDKSTDFLKVIYAGRDDMTVISEGTKEEVRKAVDEHDHIIMMGHGTPTGLLSVGKFNQPKPATQYKSKFTNEDKAITPSQLKQDTSGVKSYSSYRGGHQSSFVDDDWLDSFDAGKPYGNYGNSTYAGGGNWNNYVKDMTTGYVIDETYADVLRQKQLTTIWCNADQFIEWNKLHGFYTGMFISETGEARIIGLTEVEQWQVDESNYGFVSVVRRFIDKPAEVLHEALKLEYGKMADHNPVAKYNYRRLYLRDKKASVALAQNA